MPSRSPAHNFPKNPFHPQKLHFDETLNRARETDAKDPHFGGPSFRLCQNALDILIEAGTDFMNNSNRQLEWQQPDIQV